MNPLHVLAVFLVMLFGLIFSVKAAAFLSRPFKRGRYRSFGFKAFLLGAVCSMFFAAASFFSLFGPASQGAGIWLGVSSYAFLFCVVALLNIALTDL